MLEVLQTRLRVFSQFVHGYKRMSADNEELVAALRTLEGATVEAVTSVAEHRTAFDVGQMIAFVDVQQEAAARLCRSCWLKESV